MQRTIRTIANAKKGGSGRSKALRRTKAKPGKHRTLASGRRGRPRLDEVEAITSAVIDAARSSFLNEGYRMASMEAIAARAGVSKKTLYVRFPTKDALFTAVVKRQVAEWSEYVAQLEHAPLTTLRERLEHHAYSFLDVQARPEVQAFGRLLLSEARTFPELARIYHENATGFALDLIAGELEGAAETEHFAVKDARAAAVTFMGLMSEWSTMNSLLGISSTSAERKRVAKYRVAIFMDGRAAW